MMTLLALNVLIAFLALGVERLIGYPDWLYKIIRHPVVWMGGIISLFDKLFNREDRSFEARKLSGAFCLLALLVVVFVVTMPLMLFLRSISGGFLIEAFLATSLLAQKSLGAHVQDVFDRLGASLDEGRQSVSHIVGRNPDELSKSDISKAAIESLAENTSDGIIAPLFYLALFGLPGAVLYKAINTADSMIGHRSSKYAAFGWASARLDDIINYIPARLTGLSFAGAAIYRRNTSMKHALKAMNRDARQHVSPNAGWPEAAMAGALGIVLGGLRSYGEKQIQLATMGSGRENLTRSDIESALKLYWESLTLWLIFTGFLALLL